MSHQIPEGCLEVLGRKTRLKAIKSIPKTAVNDAYRTEDFMSFCKTDNSKKEAAKEDSSVSQKGEDVDSEYVNIYIESNPSDLSINRSELNYENNLVLYKLSKYKNIKKPRLVVTNPKTLSNSAVLKLRDVHRVRYYKNLLSEQDKLEIDSAMKTFRESLTKAEGVIQNSVTSITKLNKTCLYTEPNTKNCSVPKHVVAYEYRIVSARLNQLNIPVPELKVIIKDSTTVPEATRKKLKQIAKITHMKTLLPANELSEVEAIVTKFHESLKPKIEIMNILQDLDENIFKIAENLDPKQESKDGTAKFKSLLSEKVEVMTALFQKLETLLDCQKRAKDECNTSENTKEIADAEEADQSEPKCEWLKKVDDKLDVLKTHMKMLTEGKKPPGLRMVKEFQHPTKSNKEPKKSYSSSKKTNQYQNTSYSKGRIAHNVVMRRGGGFGRSQSFGKNAAPSGGSEVPKSFKIEIEPRDAIEGNSHKDSFKEGSFRGRGRGQSCRKNAVPSGGWGVLESYETGTEPRDAIEGQVDSFCDEGGFRGRGRGFGHRGSFSAPGRGFGNGEGFSGPGRGFGQRGNFSGPGRGFGHRGGFSGPGRDFGYEGGFSGPGRGYGFRGGFSDPGRCFGYGGGFSDPGRGFGYGGGFSGPGRGFGGARGYMGRGWGDPRGRGRGPPRALGRISKINLDAKLYAEKCKEENKVPDVCFNGVNIKGISGYPAVDKNSSLRSEDSKSQMKKESDTAVNTNKKMSAGILEVVVKKDKQTGNSDQVTKTASL